MAASYSIFIRNSSPTPVAIHDHRDVARKIGGGFGTQIRSGSTHFKRLSKYNFNGQIKI